MSRENWIREDGLEEDKLFKSHKNLKYKWQWSDIKHIKYTKRQSGGFDEKEMDSSQVSFANIYDWKLTAVHWHSEYEAYVSYRGERIISEKGIKIRLDAQIKAEELLVTWLKEEYSKMVGKL